jgi:hypothetical protein
LRLALDRKVFYDQDLARDSQAEAKARQGSGRETRKPSDRRLATKVVATIDGQRREITKRKAIVTQVVNKSTRACRAGARTLSRRLLKPRAIPAACGLDVADYHFIALLSII